MKKVLSSLLFFFFFGPAVCVAQETHLAINVWGFSRHVDRNKHYNERNWGLGVRGYYDNWFVAIDGVRNSVRGQVLSIGGGYEYPLVIIGEYTFSVTAEATHLDYHMPRRGTAHVWAILPGASVRKKELSVNLGFIPPSGKEKSVLLFFATWHFPNF